LYAPPDTLLIWQLHALNVQLVTLVNKDSVSFVMPELTLCSVKMIAHHVQKDNCVQIQPRHQVPAQPGHLVPGWTRPLVRMGNTRYWDRWNARFAILDIIAQQRRKRNEDARRARTSLHHLKAAALSAFLELAALA
jgi:hypothetical protein